MRRQVQCSLRTGAVKNEVIWEVREMLASNIQAAIWRGVRGGRYKAQKVWKEMVYNPYTEAESELWRHVTRPLMDDIKEDSYE